MVTAADAGVVQGWGRAEPRGGIWISNAASDPAGQGTGRYVRWLLCNVGSSTGEGSFTFLFNSNLYTQIEILLLRRIDAMLFGGTLLVADVRCYVWQAIGLMVSLLIL
jgi:hypothetical protein